MNPNTTNSVHRRPIARNPTFVSVDHHPSQVVRSPSHPMSRPVPMVVTIDDGDDEEPGRTNAAEKAASEYLRKHEYTEVTVPSSTAISAPHANTPEQDAIKPDVDNGYDCNLRSRTQPPYSS
eukprot:gb/GEZJ01003425.1/.p2 GENE.gb/GEZJ01003425.1/~~gb/GEZJ01003425.1/.p2  ORF type:complete len:122 (+),score=16.51 gb/GEZJ01003425.1/:1149-1514(+)